MNTSYPINYQDNYLSNYQEKCQMNYSSDYSSDYPSDYPEDYSMDYQMDYQMKYPPIYITDCQTGKQTEYIVGYSLICPSDNQNNYQSNNQNSYQTNYQNNCKQNCQMDYQPNNQKEDQIDYEETEQMDIQRSIPSKIDLYKLETPSESICLVHHKYIFSNRSLFHLYHTGGYQNTLSKSKYTIKDDEDRFKYFCEFNKKGNKHFITNLQGNCLLLFDMIKHSQSFKLNLYSNDFSSKKEVSIAFKHSSKSTKLSLKYFNPITEREELLNVLINNLNNVIEVYYGKKKEGGLLIGKAKTTDYNTNTYTVVISPNVDTIFLLFTIFISLQIKHARYRSLTPN